MPIAEFLERRPRTGIVCIGPSLSDAEKQMLAERGYYLMDASAVESDEISGIDSVVLCQSTEKPLAIGRDLERFARRLLDYDCRIYVRSAGDWLKESGKNIVDNCIARLSLPGANITNGRPLARSLTRVKVGDSLAPFVYACDANLPWTDLVQLIALNPSGQPPNTLLKVRGEDCQGNPVDFSSEQRLLCQRAFPDCSIVDLVQMQDGLSGVIAFRAFAQANGVNGSWPTLHFVKIGSRELIRKEYENYRHHTLAYVPFHLAPKLDFNRCGLASTQGILVGDFVEHAESLRDCVSSGRATAALGNLFSRTLRAWHNTATCEERSFSIALADLFPEAIPDYRKGQIESSGSTSSLETLRELLKTECASQPFLMGTIHGDLNATNILLRHSDAIVIDFEKLQENMPVIYDVASVEAALFVDVIGSDIRKTEDWFESIAELYTLGPQFERGAVCHPKKESAWFFDCVRQIRSYGKVLERAKRQYALALAVALMRKSCNGNEFDESREARRAMAFVVADRLIRAIASESEIS